MLSSRVASETSRFAGIGPRLGSLVSCVLQELKEVGIESAILLRVRVHVLLFLSDLGYRMADSD